MQKKFILEVIENINAPSARELVRRGIIDNYATLKNYLSERRTLPEDVFNDMCYVAKIDKDDLRFEILEDNYGCVVGGKKSKRRV